MRFLSLLLAGWLAAALVARADEQLVKRFDGHTSLTTADFTVPDGWEIRWHSNQVLSIGVIRLDNTVISGTTGKNLGSLYLPQGGSYRIRIKGEEDIPWDVAIYSIGTAGSDAPPSVDDADFFQPTPGPTFTPVPETAADTNAAPAIVSPTPATDSAADTNAAPQPPTPPPIPTELTADQARAIVSVHGDRLQGEGFFVKTSTGTMLVTAQQLISDNPNLQVTDSSGNEVKITKIQCAPDRDVAMLSVKDTGYAALDQGNPSQLVNGDSILTAAANGTSFDPASVNAIAPVRIDVDQLRPIIGAPLVLAKTGQVVGMSDATPQSLLSTSMNDKSFDERDALANSLAAGGVRIDNVAAWDACDATKLQVQAQFLEGFHQRSRALDAYMNGSASSRSQKLWQADDKIKSANATFLSDTAGGNPQERNTALHALMFELGVVGEIDMDQVQVPANFYGFEQLRAKDEIGYRQALKAQIDSYDSDVSKFNPIAVRNNSY